MKFLESSNGKRPLVGWLGVVSSLLFACVNFLPAGRPQSIGSIDDSWTEVMHFAFLNHLQFGREIVFTYGPWGFLYAGYQPKTHWIAVAVWLALAIVFWCAARRVARLSFENELARWTWLMAVTGLIGITVSRNIDERMMCFPLLLIILQFFDESSVGSALQIGLVVCMGLLSLVRFPIFIVNSGIVALISADAICRRRRVPWCLAAFGGSLLIFWMIAGQKLSLFWPYLRSSWKVASGYTEAFIMSGPYEKEFAGGFLIVAFASCGALAFILWKRLRFFGMTCLAAFTFIVFAAFKYSFVRDDTHQATGAVELLVVALMCFAIGWPVVREKRQAFKIGLFLPIAAACVFAEFSFDRFDLTPFFKQSVETLNPQTWSTRFEAFSGGESSREAYRQYLASYRERYPLPFLNGDTDSYSWNQIQLFANGLSFRPRPVLHSYMAYTPQLAELDAAHLRSEEAPQNIIWDGSVLDNQYPSLEDGPSWPELLTRYEMQQVEISFAVLTRSPTPRKFNLTPLLDTSVKFGDQLSVPAATNSLLWAEIEIDHNAVGSVVSTLYKPPEVSLNTTLHSGQQRSDRLIPGMARCGFLLSPLVWNGAGFAAVASTDWPKLLTDNVVTSFSITASNSLTPCYKNAIRVRLYWLDFPKKDLARVQGYGHTIELMDTVQKATLLQDGQFVYLRDAGSVFGVPANSTILLDRPLGSSRLRLAFGMYVPNETPNTNGITFQISALNADQGKKPLWSCHINPSQSSKDHGKQEAVVDLGDEKISRVAVETISDRGVTNEVLRPYWSEIHFESP